MRAAGDIERIMTPKQRVLKKYPKAHAYKHGLYWHYVTKTRESGVVLGCANSRRSAWASAAQRVDGSNPP